MQNIEVKENDVFKFRWNTAEAQKRYEPYHCFDGTLTAKKTDNEIMLIDSYWSGGGKRFTINEALEMGELKFLCNLNDMQDIRESDVQYYDNVVKLHIHAGYRNQFLIKRGQQRSMSVMLQSIESKIEEKQREIKYAQMSLAQLIETKAKIEKGDLSTYF